MYSRKPLFAVVLVCIALLMSACSPREQASQGGAGSVAPAWGNKPSAAAAAASFQAPQAERFAPQTIGELRAFTPGRFAYTDLTRAGGVQVNVPVILPAVSALPIHTLRKDAISASDVRRMGDILLADIGEQQPQDNANTPDVPYSRITAVLASLFPDAQFYLAGQPLPHDADCGCGTIFSPLLVGQTLGGVPIFAETDVHASAADGHMEAAVGLRVSPSADGTMFSMEGSVATPVSTLVQDAALAPFEQIARVLEARIRSGHIRSIESISLGYMLCCAQPSALKQAAQAAEMLAVPTWEVVGAIVADPDAPNPSVLERGTFLIDAMSGKPLDEHTSPAPSVHTLAGIML